jgi:hypothetical protein
MVHIDAEIHFDDGAASEAVATVRSAVLALERVLAARRFNLYELDPLWDGYAHRWFTERNSGLELVSTTTLEYLRQLVADLERQRALAHQDRAEQYAARIARAEAEAQRRAAEQRAAEARAASANVAIIGDAGSSRAGGAGEQQQ